MQFMVFMIPAVYQPKSGQPQPGPDFKPDPKMMAEMGKFNASLGGAVKSLNGFLPLATGARLAFAGGKPTLTDGPAIKTPEVVGGYWLVEAKSKQEVIEWFKRCPAQDGDTLEIRQIAEFPPEAQKAAKEPRAATRAPLESGAKARSGHTKPPQPAVREKSRGPWKSTKGIRTKEQD